MKGHKEIENTEKKRKVIRDKSWEIQFLTKIIG